MEPQHPQQPPPNSDHKDDDVSPFTGKIGTRWTPTADHVRILKDLYYVSGVRSPTTDQIQRITNRLRQYGKIEAKNVFYWFQNHKARERNKRRFTLSHVPLPPPTPHKQKGPRGVGKHQNNCAAGGADTTPHGFSSSGLPSSSSSGLLGFGQIDTSGGSYNSALPMENSFSGCPISAAPGHGIFGGWVGINPYTSSYTVFENQRPSSVYESSSEGLECGGCTPEKETLPLFPMSGGNDIYKLNSDNRHINGSSDTNSLTSSLDLSLCPVTARKSPPTAVLTEFV